MAGMPSLIDGRRVYAHEPAITDQQVRFARALAGGLTQTEAARVAGYADPGVAGNRLSRTPAVREAIRLMRTQRLDRLASLSLRALEEMVRGYRTWEGAKVPISAAVRFNAVKLSLALAGHVEPKAPSEDDANPLKRKQVEEMTIEELDAFINDTRRKRAERAKPIIDQPNGQDSAKTLKYNEKTEPIQGCVLDGEAIPIPGPSAERDGAAAVDASPAPGGMSD